jgi:hypothetical protein
MSLGILDKATPACLSTVMAVSTLWHFTREAWNDKTCRIWATALFAVRAGVGGHHKISDYLCMKGLDVFLLELDDFFHFGHIPFSGLS